MTVSLVTGGAGFIGSHVVDHLIRMGHKVVILDDLSGGKLDNVPVNAHFENASVLNDFTLSRIFGQNQIDYVFHLAAYAAEALSHHVRVFNYTNNLIGSVNLINAAVNAGTVKRFVFTSSAAVYGAKATSVGSTSEEQSPTPIDPYGIAKYAVEMDLRAAQSHFGLDYTVFRPHNVYGERQNLSDGYRNVIGIFMRQCLRGEPMTLYGTAYKTRQFSHIDDVAPYIAQCIDVPEATNQVFNIGSDSSYEIDSIASKVALSLGVPFRTAVWPERDEARHVAVNHSKFKRVFNPKQDVALDIGIARMAAWARTQTLGEPKPFAGIEIEKNLPESWRAR